MKSEATVLAKYRMSRAHEAFIEGEHLLSVSAHAGAVNRFYYAAFHAARALLATLELDSTKHKGVILLFQAHFVKTGIISISSAKALPRSFEKRQKSDYDDFTRVTPEEAEKVKNEVSVLVRECEGVLERLTGMEPSGVS